MPRLDDYKLKHKGIDGYVSYMINVALLSLKTTVTAFITQNVSKSLDGQVASISVTTVTAITTTHTVSEALDGQVASLSVTTLVE